MIVDPSELRSRPRRGERVRGNGTPGASGFAAGPARPNHSLEPTRSGRQRKPGLRYAVHLLSPGLRCLPPRAAQLER